MSPVESVLMLQVKFADSSDKIRWIQSWSSGVRENVVAFPKTISSGIWQELRTVDWEQTIDIRFETVVVYFALNNWMEFTVSTQSTHFTPTIIVK
jgi:hypothetical protein